MSHNDARELDRLKNLPQPPEKPKSKGIHSFVEMDAEVKYLLSGVTSIVCRTNDKKEPCDVDGDSVLDPYIRDSEGRPAISGKRGWPDTEIEEDDTFDSFEVPVWYPENFAVLVKKVSLTANAKYLNDNSETMQQTLAKIQYVQSTHYKAFIGDKDVDGNDIKPLFPDMAGYTDIPYLGQMFGDVTYNINKLIASVLAAGGRIVPCGNQKGWETVPVSAEEVMDNLPLNFDQMKDEDGLPVWEQVMTIGGLLDFTRVQEELVQDGELTPTQDDELKNSLQVSEGSDSEKPKRRRSKDSKESPVTA